MPEFYLGQQEAQWKKLKLSNGEIEVLLRKPTYAEVIYDLSAGYEAALKSRFENLILDWKGVNVNGQPLKYSFKALCSIIEAAPEVGFEITLAIGEMFTAASPKNLPSPPATSSADGQTETPNTTTSADSSSDYEITPC